MFLLCSSVLAFSAMKSLAFQCVTFLCKEYPSFHQKCAERTLACLLNIITKYLNSPKNAGGCC